MFQSLRPNNQIYVLFKDQDEPKLEVGTIVSVSNPIPKYPMQPAFGQPQEFVVDVVAKINGQDINYQKLPANLDVADFGNNSIVLSDNKDAMNSELMCLKQKSVDAVNSIEYHKNMIVVYDKLITKLNPELQQKQQQQEEINALKDQVSKVTSNLESLLEMNRQLMLQLKGSETAK